MEYVRALKVESPGSNLKILNRSDSKLLPYQAKFDLFTFFKGSLFKYLRDSIKILKENDSSSIILVAGDPWTSFLFSVFFRLFLKKARIQVQFHGDVFTPKWKYQNFKFLLKFISLIPAVFLANQIRLVSNAQKISFDKVFPRFLNKTFVSPVPYSLKFESNKIAKVKKENVFNFAFVGRIEFDRGIVYLISIMKRSLSLDIPFYLHVIGDGSKRNWFYSEIYFSWKFRNKFFN